MKLNRMQVLVLNHYIEHRAHPPTLGRMLLSGLTCWLFVGLGCAGSAFGCYWMGIPEGGLAFAVLFVGVVLSMIGRARVLVAAWPLIESVVDWEKVEAVRREHQITNFTR